MHTHTHTYAYIIHTYIYISCKFWFLLLYIQVKSTLIFSVFCADALLQIPHSLFWIILLNFSHINFPPKKYWMRNKFWLFGFSVIWTRSRNGSEKWWWLIVAIKVESLKKYIFMLKCCYCAKGKKKVTQSCPTLWVSMDCSPPGSSVHGTFQARLLEWVAISFSRETSQSRDWTQGSYPGLLHCRQILIIWATKEAL